MLFFQEKLTSSLENGMAVFLLSNFFDFMQKHSELCNQPSFSFWQYLLENLELKQCVVHGDKSFNSSF